MSVTILFVLRLVLLFEHVCYLGWDFCTCICNACTRVGVKYFSEYLSQVQVLFHICKYKSKYSEYLEDIKYFFNQVQVKYKYFGNKQ